MSTEETTTAQARARLRTTLAWQTKPGTLISTVLLAILGFAAAIQIATPDDVLDRASRTDLVQILDGLGTRADQLEDEVARLEEARADLVAGAGDSEAAQAEAQDRLLTLGILAGTSAAQGPGVELGIVDLGDDVDASSMLSTVQELRDAGAEALQIDGAGERSVRVVASTAFADAATGGVTVGGVTLTQPYSITAIGDPATLSTALGIPGGAVATIESAGATVSVRESRELVVDTLHEPVEPSYARPAVPDDTESAG